MKYGRSSILMILFLFSKEAFTSQISEPRLKEIVVQIAKIGIKEHQFNIPGEKWKFINSQGEVVLAHANPPKIYPRKDIYVRVPLKTAMPDQKIRIRISEIPDIKTINENPVVIAQAGLDISTEYLGVAESSSKQFKLKNEKLNFVGTAEDAKVGAILVTNKKTYYIEGLDYWPDSARGKLVRVIGMSEEKKIIPDPITKKGLAAQGAIGRQSVIKGAIWALEKIVPAHPGYIISIEFPGGTETKKVWYKGYLWALKRQKEAKPF